MYKPITVKDLKECINDNNIPDDFIIKHTDEEIIIVPPNGDTPEYHLYEDDD